MAIIVIILACVRLIASHAHRMSTGGMNFLTSEWLINYAGGLHRRGLFGWLYISFFPEGQLGLWLLYAFQIALLCVPAVYALAWLHRTGYDWFAVALILSPGAYMFAAWDTGAFGRKESMGFTALTFLALAARRGTIAARRHVLASSALLLFALGAGSWEALVVMLPAALYLISIGAYERSRSVYAGGFSIIGIGGAAFGYLLPGDDHERVASCEAMIRKGLDADLCRQAMSYIGSGLDRIIDQVVGSYPAYFMYVPLVALTVLPLLSSYWLQSQMKLAIASAIFILPLFFIAADYGRWANILVIELLICLMSTETIPKSRLHWSPAWVTLYLVGWGIPHWFDEASGSFPWTGLLQSVVEAAQKMFAA